MATTPALTLQLVGTFALDGLTGAPPGGQAARLLKILGSQPDHTWSIDAIVEGLWGHTPPPAAARNVASLVSRLRKLLGRDTVVGSSQGYRLQLSPPLTTDLSQAEDLVRSAEADLAAGSFGLAEYAASAAAQILQRGDVMAGEPDAEWVSRARAAAAHLHRTARSIHWQAATRNGDFPAAILASEAALLADPFDEEACRALMEALWQSGRPAAALQAYEQLRRTLADALGIDPAPASQSLYLSILHSEVPPRAEPEETTRSGPTLVGRDSEVAGLVGAWQTVVSRGARRSHEGDSGLAVILASSGMGKRALVDLLETRVRETGGEVLRVGCLDSERSLFLQPLVQAVRQVLLTRPPGLARELLGQGAGPLADLIPELGPILGDAAYDRFLPEAHQRRVMEAIAGVLANLSRTRPLLVVVEALHNANQSTLDAIHFLHQRLAGDRVLIVGTARSTDGARVRDSLGHQASYFQPGTLTRSQVAEFLQLNESTLDPARAFELTGGSPLYLTELVRSRESASDDDVPLPDSLREAVRSRLPAVGTPVLEILQVASIFGRRFTLDQVATLAQLRVEDCATLIAEALRADFLTTRRTSFAFANEILREVLYQSTPEPTRISRHHRAAQLSQANPEAAAAHWSAAGDWQRASATWLQAAEAAHRALANVEAERLATLAVDAARQAERLEPLARTLIRRGQFRCELGNYRDATHDQTEALDLARELIDADLEAFALEQLGWTALFARDAASAADLADRSTRLAEAAAAAPGAPRSAALLLGRVRHWDGDYVGADRAYDQVISQRPDDDIAAQALAFRGALLQHQDRFAEARQTLQQAIALSRQTGLFRTLLQALFFTALAQGDCGDFAGGLRNLQRARKLIVDNGTDYYTAGIDTSTSWLLRELGDLEGAREVAERAVTSAERGGGALELEQGLHAVLARAECELAEGAYDDAGATVEAALPFLDRPLPFRARATMRLLDMQSVFDPERADELLTLAQESASPKYQALALSRQGRHDEAQRLALSLGSDQLLAYVGDKDTSWRAITRLRDAMPAELREDFLDRGRLPRHWLARFG